MNRRDRVGLASIAAIAFASAWAYGGMALDRSHDGLSHWDERGNRLMIDDDMREDGGNLAQTLYDQMLDAEKKAGRPESSSGFFPLETGDGVAKGQTVTSVGSRLLNCYKLVEPSNTQRPIIYRCVIKGLSKNWAPK